ncbi:MAG: hypothetical protein JW959_04410, partial [Pirellulales bacterium]|nr:hypothetical protein [Pirellulales bacterium]
MNSITTTLVPLLYRGTKNALSCVVRIPAQGMGAWLGFSLSIVLVVLLSSADAERRKTREIYVPFSDLHVLLENQPKRVLVGREEYEALLKKAELAPEAGAPLPATVTAADYAIEADRQRAEIVGELIVDVLQDGLHAVLLDLGGVGLRSARLDDRAAPIGLGPDGRLRLFVEGVGQHRLKLEMTAPLETTAARQVLNYRLPRPPAVALRLEVPGDVEIKGGADVIGRKVVGGRTRFELLQRPGDTSLLMTLNSHLNRAERLVVARCVLLDEISESHEKLRASVTFSVLHRAVDSFSIAAPEGFEITEASSPLLARWEVVERGGRRVLEVRLRERTRENVELNLTAVRAPAVLDGWTAPRLTPLDAVGCVSVFGLLVDERLKAESLSPEGLIPIDTSAIGADAPRFRAVAAWYAPRSDFSLKARFVRPAAEMDAATCLLLAVSDKGLELDGGLSLVPRVEKRFWFDLAVPAGWQVARVATPDGKRLPHEFYRSAMSHDSSSLPEGEGAEIAGRVRVSVSEGMPVDRPFTVNFRAVHTPKNWLADWRRTTVEFPKFSVLDALRSEGAAAVEVSDDMTVRPEKLERLVPLGAEEKKRFGLGDEAVLAYRREGPDYSAELAVERTEPRTTARTFSFLRIDRDALHCHYEVAYTVEQSRVRRLALSLPRETPETASIAGLDGVEIKEFTSAISGERRLWTVALAEPRRDRVRLAVDFQQRLPEAERKDFSLPIVEAEEVEYQSGLVAVEGCAELEVGVETMAQRVDVGELAEADCLPGRRLLGAYGFVGGPPAVKIDVGRRPGYAIPEAIAQRCELDTFLAPDGSSRTQARFELRSKASFLRVALPLGAKLWSAELNGVPLKPQRDRGGVLIDLSSGNAESLQSLMIVYADDTLHATGLRGTVRVPAPRLFLHNSAGTGPFFGGKTKSVDKTSAENMDLSPSPAEVPLVDLLWRLHLPGGYEVVKAGGTLSSDEIVRPMPAAFQLAGALYRFSGGVRGPHFLFSTHRYAREAARKGYRKLVSDKPLVTALSDKPRPESAVAEPKSAELDLSGIVAGGEGRPGSGKDIYAPIDLADRSAAEKRIEAVLDSPAHIEFIDTPLKAVIDYLEDFHKIEIQIDTRALSDMGIDADTPVTKNLKGVSLRSALELMLRDLDLTYMVTNDVLLITTPECAESELTTVVYPVTDLVTFRDKSGEIWTDFDSLIELIACTVSPTTWDEVGGSGTIAPQTVGNTQVIVLSQTQEVHRELARVLAKLREVGRLQPSDGRPPLKEKPQYPPGAMGGAGMGGMGMSGGFGGMMPPETTPPPSQDNVPLDGVYPPLSADKPPTVAPMPGPAAAEKPKDVDESGQAIAAKVKEKHEEGERLPEEIEYPDVDETVMFTAPRRELAGVRSLKIDLLQSPEDSGKTVAFRSLGAEPELVVTLVDDSRFKSLRWAFAMAVILAGLALTRRTVRTKSAYVLGVMVPTTLLALAGGIEISEICNWMFLAAALLVPYYLVAGFMRWACRLCWRICLWFVEILRGRKTVSAAVLAAVVLGTSFSQAADPQAEKKRIIALPEDAIILPYDPEWKNGVKDADKMLVPYDKYVELWNRAYPERKIETKATPAKYALADASYKTLLDGEDYLLLTGQMEIDVFVDGYIEVPLGLGGGVLTRAELDGQPARISAIIPQERAAPQQRAPDDPFIPAPRKTSEHNPFAGKRPPADRPVIVLHVSGKGRRKLELDVRMKLRRQGGWRMVEGVLPAAPATALDIAVPKPKTELRLGHVADCRHYETEKADQTVRTALGIDGAVSMQWRLRIDAGAIDRSLTVASDAVFDVCEDGLRLDWKLSLEFRGSERDRFGVELPKGYLLEKVDGANVRGWEVGEGEGGPVVEVMLLQAAKGREQFALRLWRADRIGGPKPAAFDAPLVTVADAALQSGRLTVRRSPLIELRTLERSGVTRIDLPAKKTPSAGVESPLGIRPFEAYGFATVPFTLRFSAAEVEARVSAVVQTLLKLSEYESSLESRVKFEVAGRPVYRLRLLLPEGFRLDRVDAAGEFQYTVKEDGKRPLLTMYFAAGEEGEVPVLLFGRLARQPAGSDGEIPLPCVAVLDAERQQGDVVVQSDPGNDVEAVELAGCEPVLLGRVFGWLNPVQRSLARLALHYSGGEYSGRMRLTPRVPDVVCDTITNVRVTDRALEETILLDFNVSRAGVRRLEFLLPEAMADSRFSTPLLQRKIIAPAGAEHPGMVRARIELQEEAMGEIRLQITNDRLLTPGSHQAPIPVIIGASTGGKKGQTPFAGTARGTPRTNGDSPLFSVRVNRRYAVIENSSRGEVVVEQDRLLGMNVLGRQGKDWTFLQSCLGENLTMAYLVSSRAERPRLSFHVESRAAVETVQANIGLSETTLVVDPSGAYRAQVVLHVNNATEQYLDVELPQAASLWTVRVAGEPVKPTLAYDGKQSSPDRRKVRVPLIKTAPGDLSYELVLRYGGRMPAPGTIGKSEFPMIRCLNITPELSQARLYLPEQYRWFDFGGTMRPVADDVGLQMGLLQFQQDQIRQIGAALHGSDKWSKARALASLGQAANNLKQIGLAVRYYKQTQAAMPVDFAAALSANADLIEQTRQEAARQETTVAENYGEYNRQRLGKVVQAQKTQRAKNYVQSLGSNWAQPALPKPDGVQTPAFETKSTISTVAPRVVIQEDEKEGKKPSSRPEAEGRGPQRQAPDDYAYERYQQQLNKQAPIVGGQPVRPEEPEPAPGIYDPFALQPESPSRAGDAGVKLPDQSRESGGELTAPAQRPSSGLASLDFELPVRGAVHRFTTPRGQQRITARYVSSEVILRLLETAVVGFAIAILWLVAGMVRRGGCDWLSRPAGSWLLIA